VETQFEGDEVIPTPYTNTDTNISISDIVVQHTHLFQYHII